MGFHLKNTTTMVVLVWAALSFACGHSGAQDDPFASFTRKGRDDPVWHDSQAEMAVYEATRTIYGQSRQFTAKLYTNKELADKDTKTKSSKQRGREVFKHHQRQDIPTDNYTYHFSTMCYVGVTDLKSLKIDMGSQEDCGATYKQFVNHAGTCQWKQSSYFPDEGYRTGSYRPTKRYAFADGLSVILRGYPFDERPQVRVDLLPSQTSNKWTDFRPAPATVRYVGAETIAAPIGDVDTHHLVVEADDGQHHYWFAAQGGAPWLHVMVQYEGPATGGIMMKLREHRRWAYWKR